MRSIVGSVITVLIVVWIILILTYQAVVVTRLPEKILRRLDWWSGVQTAATVIVEGARSFVYRDYIWAEE